MVQKYIVNTLHGARVLYARAFGYMGVPLPMEFVSGSNSRWFVDGRKKLIRDVNPKLDDVKANWGTEIRMFRTLRRMGIDARFVQRQDIGDPNYGSPIGKYQWFVKVGRQPTKPGTGRYEQGFQGRVLVYPETPAPTARYLARLPATLEGSEVIYAIKGRRSKLGSGTGRALGRLPALAAG